MTNNFGGLLGSTFNYVFENQLTNLQNGDRFYYLGRTPGMNLRAQLEGNSFAELVMRNTDAYSLKADPFATADCKFHLGDIAPGTAAAGSFLTGPGTVNDVLSSECDENRLLLRQPNGRIEYRAINSVDPSGINGQGVYDATDGVDRVFGGNDNDTIWGRDGADIIDGRGGDDVVLGGFGNDIITDFAGFDVLKGGPGNDAIDGGVLDDIIMGGDGDDFTNGGANNDEHFMGAGNDFTIGGQGFSAVFGDSGDDWEEGGDMADLLIGDSSTLFFDDHNIPGHDVTIGQGGDDDYDTEGGDDIMVGGPGVEKNAGASGYDWLIGLGDPQPQFADLNLKILPEGQPAIEVRDRFNEVEALSGWKFDDQLFGDDPAPAATGGGGFIGCDVLSQSGLDRITGLAAYIPDLSAAPPAAGTTPANDILGNTTTRYCLIEPNTNVWGAGNILLGGGGSDRIEGRGADDIIDGDTYMNVRLSVRTNVLDPATEIGTTDLMEHQYLHDSNGLPTGPTLQAAVFAGTVDPGKIAIVREILLPVVPDADCDSTTPLNCDTALFSAPRDGYVITDLGNGVVTVSDAAGAAVDGTDTLWNVERAGFCTATDANGLCTAREYVSLASAPDFPVLTITTPGPGTLDVAFGSVNTGVLAPAQSITVGNAGSAPLTVSGVTVTGADASQFTATPAAGCSSIAAGASCIVSVRFAPTSIGAKEAFVNITHNSLNVAGTVTTVSVDGTGLAPVAGVAPGSLAFGSVNTGTLSATQTRHGEQQRQRTAHGDQHRRDRYQRSNVHRDTHRLQCGDSTGSVVHDHGAVRADQHRGKDGHRQRHPQQQQRCGNGVERDLERNRCCGHAATPAHGATGVDACHVRLRCAAHQRQPDRQVASDESRSRCARDHQRHHIRWCVHGHSRRLPGVFGRRTELQTQCHLPADCSPVVHRNSDTDQQWFQQSDSHNPHRNREVARRTKAWLWCGLPGSTPEPEANVRKG